MSHSPFHSPNPYQASAEVGYGGNQPQQRPQVPMFTIVMAIIDMLLLCLRALLVLFGIVGLLSIQNNDMVTETGIYEVAAGLLMVLFGFTADIAMLMKQPWAVILAAVKILATLGSILVGLWQLSYMLAEVPQGSPEYTGMMIGAGITTIVRILLVFLYSAAVAFFHNAMQKGRAAATSW